MTSINIIDFPIEIDDNFFYGELFFPNLRLRVKVFQFLRLSTKFWAVLRLSVNPIETLLEEPRLHGTLQT